MAGGGEEQRSLEETPTWAVAVVCFILVVISFIIEYIIQLIGAWLKKKHKRALYESLEKIKSELMLLGFISLLLTVVQGPISEICISKSIADTWHPCGKKDENAKYNNKEASSEDLLSHRRLLSDSGAKLRRILAGGSGATCAEGKVPFISNDGINELHIFIFALALSHVLYCVITMALSRLKMKKWKAWEKETRTVEYQYMHDPERFRFARDTSFGRRHLKFWSKSPVLLWIASFFRQFFRSVPKVDYLTLRHGFIMAHLAPQSANKFNFQKYINRSLEEDFKVVVGISPVIWFLAVLFLLFNKDGWYAYLWLPFLPLIIILLVGTKLQVIVTRMGLRIQDRGDVVKGVPTVQPADDLFWFGRPQLMLFLINFVLFQNAFQIAFFAFSWYKYGFRSCFHEKLADVIIRITMGALIQFLCSYVTLPLYALVTQMGSTMKPTIFNDRVATALKNWHHTAKKQIKQDLRSATVTPMSSRPTTPTHGTSPLHLLRYYHSEASSPQTSPRRSNTDQGHCESEPSSPMQQPSDGSLSPHHRTQNDQQRDDAITDISLSDMPPRPIPIIAQHEIIIGSSDQQEIKIGSKEFSFDKR